MYFEKFICIIIHCTVRFSCVQNDEARAILPSYGRKELSRDEALAILDTKIDSIRTRCVRNESLLFEACSRMTDTDAFLAALENRPSLSQFPLTSSEVGQSEPANKKIAPQRHFTSTKARSKRPAELSLRKPTADEKKYVLNTLDGSMPVVLQNRLNTDHDYDLCPSDLVNNDHAYN